MQTKAKNMATKEQVGKVTTPAILTNISRALEGQMERGWLPEPYTPPNGPTDIAISMGESVWWYDQITEFRSWPTFEEELDNPVDARLFSFEGWFAPWATDYAKAYTQHLYKERLHQHSLVEGLLQVSGPLLDPRTPDRRHLFQRVLRLMMFLPAREETLLNFAYAVCANELNKRESWIIKAREALAGPNEGPFSHDNPSLAMVKADGDRITDDYIEILWDLNEHLGACAAHIQAVADGPGADDADSERMDFLSGVFNSRITALNETLARGQEKLRDITPMIVATRQQVARARDEQSMERLVNYQEIAIKRVGYQARSFRTQRKLTIREVAIGILKITNEELTDTDSSTWEESTIKVMCNNVSRVERGDRGKRGLQTNFENALCEVLQCSGRELKQAPLGYHLSNCNLVQIYFEGEKARFEKTTAVVSLDHDTFPDEYKRPNQQLQDSVCYLPPLYDSKDVHELKQQERESIVRCAIQYHWLPQADLIRDNTEFRAELNIPTRTDIAIMATEQMELMDWNEIEKPRATLHAFVVCQKLEDLAGYRTGAGFSWANHWHKIVEAEATRENMVAALSDEVGASAHRSSFPDPSNKETIPVLGYARGGEYDMQYVDNGSAFEHIETPPVLAKIKDAFAVVVSNDSMEPRYDPGDYLYCHPNQIPKKGDYVVVALTEQRAVVKRFIRQRPETIELEQLNPFEAFEIKREDVIRLFVIVGTKTR
jgi:phage repressor protein C with HTH and peptisase S24 domain